jgi:hypothetical protein
LKSKEQISKERRARYKKNKEKVREQVYKWRLANPERFNIIQDRVKAKQIVEYNERLKNHFCKCGSSLADKNFRYDHCDSCRPAVYAIQHRKAALRYYYRNKRGKK